MMMRMLEAGGVPPLTDHLREADDDNPGGYYEFERAKELKTDVSWLPEARGRAVKIISALLEHLPADVRCKVVFMRRNMEEVLASQRRMLERRNQPTDRSSDERMSQLFEKHLDQIDRKIADHPGLEVIYVSYNDILEDPAPQVSKINEFFDGRLDEMAMCAIVDPTLYRQQNS